MTDLKLLKTKQMAHFAAKGFISFPSAVPDHINQKFLDDIGEAPSENEKGMMSHYSNIMKSSTIPLVPAGTSLKDSYPEGTALNELINLPEISGAIESLVGLDCLLDHHFLHITFPQKYWEKSKTPQRSQSIHQDSTIDPRKAFDIQIFYFPHEVTKEMGGTRYIPGTHFRVVSESSISRYQNIKGQEHVICPAGTVMIFHMGLWHGGGLNQSDQLRYLFKIRLCPKRRQLRLWEEGQIKNETEPQRPIFWTDGKKQKDHLFSILTKPEPWFEMDSGRLEYLNRIRFWRYISGDDNFDADYWVTRVENEFL